MGLSRKGSEMSHTPGPRVVQAFDEAQMCVLGPACDGGRRELVGVFTGERRMDNAALDAAAPELLDALRNMVGMFDTPVVRRHYNSDFHREACESARCAIAKAEGRS